MVVDGPSYSVQNKLLASLTNNSQAPETISDDSNSVTDEIEVDNGSDENVDGGQLTFVVS